MKNYPVIQRDIKWMNQMQVWARMAKLRTIINKYTPEWYDTCNFEEWQFYDLIKYLHLSEENKNSVNYRASYEYNSWKPFYEYCRDWNTKSLYWWFKQFIARGIAKKKNSIEVYNGCEIHRIIDDIATETKEYVERQQSYKEREENHEKYLKQKIEKRDKDYNDYLKSDIRREKRKLVFEKEWWMCAMCWDSEWPRDCHHRKYDKFSKEDEIKDLYLLCRNCHDWHHKNPDKQSYYRILRDALNEPTETTVT